MKKNEDGMKDIILKIFSFSKRNFIDILID
jgi:hypothetical protein